MRLYIIIFSGLMGLTTTAHAGPGFFAGITYMFDQPGQIGLTFKALASRNDDQPAAAVGLNVYSIPAGGLRYGLDVSVGYQKDDAAVLVGYDLVLDRMTASAGYADIKGD